MPHLDSLGTGNDLGHESVIDALMDEETRRTGTHLSLYGDTQVKDNNRCSQYGKGGQPIEMRRTSLVLQGEYLVQSKQYST